MVFVKDSGVLRILQRQMKRNLDNCEILFNFMKFIKLFLKERGQVQLIVSYI